MTELAGQPSQSLPPAPVTPRMLVRHRTLVVRRFESLLAQRGWERKGGSYFGYYRTPYGSYEGRIVLRFDTDPSFYITHPPDCLWLHSHAPCFRRKGGDTYEVHFARRGKTLDDGLLAVEQILTEAHRDQ